MSLSTLSIVELHNFYTNLHRNDNHLHCPHLPVSPAMIQSDHKFQTNKTSTTKTVTQKTSQCCVTSLWSVLCARHRTHIFFCCFCFVTHTLSSQMSSYTQYSSTVCSYANKWWKIISPTFVRGGPGAQLALRSGPNTHSSSENKCGGGGGGNHFERTRG